MPDGFMKFLSSLPNPAEAATLLKEVNVLVDRLKDTPKGKLDTVKGILDDVVELQRENPGVEPLKLAVELIKEINQTSEEKIRDIRKVIKEAAKLPQKLPELFKEE